MDPKKMMKQIDDARAVMGAQMDALNAMTPAAPVLGGAAHSANSMLEASLQAQWRNVGQALGALAQAEAGARDALAGARPPPARPVGDDVVDVVARDVQPS
jgi:hypothetical protein